MKINWVKDGKKLKIDRPPNSPASILAEVVVYKYDCESYVRIDFSWASSRCYRTDELDAQIEESKNLCLRQLRMVRDQINGMLGEDLTAAVWPNVEFKQ